MQINPDLAHLTTASAKELLAGDIEGYRLPLMELIERQAAEIERLTRDRDSYALHERNIARECDRLSAALERAERVNAMVGALAVTTEELRRIRNAGKITFDKMVYAITTCLIDMREALASSASLNTPTGPTTVSLESPHANEPPAAADLAAGRRLSAGEQSSDG